MVCICRAILRKSKLVLFDEATANIDVVSEKRIQNLIHKELKNATILTIAHRINTVNSSDKVLVLDKGKLVEFDSPEELQKNSNSLYLALAREFDHSKNTETT